MDSNPVPQGAPMTFGPQTPPSLPPPASVGVRPPVSGHSTPDANVTPPGSPHQRPKRDHPMTPVSESRASHAPAKKGMTESPAPEVDDRLGPEQEVFDNMMDPSDPEYDSKPLPSIPTLPGFA